MAEVSYPQLRRDLTDDVSQRHRRRSHHHHHRRSQNMTLTLDDSDLYASDLEFSATDLSLLPLNGLDLLDRRNFVMDLFHQRVEQSDQVTPRDDSDNNHSCTDPGSLLGIDSGFGVIEGSSGIGIDSLELDLEFGPEFVESGNCAFVVENVGDSDIDVSVEVNVNDCDDKDDDFFVERRDSCLESGGSALSMQRIGDCFRIQGIGSDSDDDEEDASEIGIDGDRFGLDLNSGEEYVNDDGEDASVTSPFRWHSLHLEDNQEANEDFEWEEVDAGLDEREIPTVFLEAENDEDDDDSVTVTHITAHEDVVDDEQYGNLGWEVLLTSYNFESNRDQESIAEPYLDHHDDYIHTAEYEMLFEQFAEHEASLISRPPASKAIVKNLPQMVLTQEDLEKNNASCAVCKDEMNVGDKGTQLPCSHRYHGECITPWLGIRNTCPVCRHELPTDDQEYERRKRQRGGLGAL